MAYTNYKSEHPNQVHQLLVSPSRHLWIKKNGQIDYQKKLFGINKTDLLSNKEKLFLRYVIRDHNSKTLYCEYCRFARPLDLIEFLHRAWMPKIGTERPQVFCGMPEFLMIPENIESETLEAALAGVGVKALKPPSGFASGMRVFRELDDFEREFSFWNREKHPPTSGNLEFSILEFIHEYNTTRPIDHRKLSPWEILQEHFKRCPPLFPPLIEKFSGKTLPALPPSHELYEMPVSIQAWLISEHLRKNGDELTYPGLLSELAEAEVRPVYEEWDDFTPYEKFQSEEDKRALAGFKYRFKSAMVRALKYDPTCMMALSYFGSFLKDEGEYADAERYLRNAIEIGRQKVISDNDYHPHYIINNRPYLRALWALSDLLLLQRRLAEAEVFIRELRRLDKDDLYESSKLQRRATLTQ